MKTKLTNEEIRNIHKVEDIIWWDNLSDEALINFENRRSKNGLYE